MESTELYLDPDESQDATREWPGAQAYEEAPVREERTTVGWDSADRLISISALILTLSPFMGWYTGASVGVQVSVTGWHTGLLGKLVFVVGLLLLAILILQVFGIHLIPASVPESLVFIGLGALATMFLLLRVLSVPASMLPADSRSIGLWISLLSALGVIAGGLLRASEEL